MYRLGREVKPHAGPLAIVPDDVIGATDLALTAVAVNPTGTAVAALAAGSSGQRPDARLFCYHTESGSCTCYDFTNDGVVPVSLAWDTEEPHLIAVQVQARAVYFAWY